MYSEKFIKEMLHGPVYLFWYGVLVGGVFIAGVVALLSLYVLHCSH
jgi:hypothetical protein